MSPQLHQGYEVEDLEWFPYVVVRGQYSFSARPENSARQSDNVMTQGRIYPLQFAYLPNKVVEDATATATQHWTLLLVTWRVRGHMPPVFC